MTRLISILSAIAKYRAILYPAVIAFVGALVHLVGWSTDVEKKVVTFIDAAFGLLAAGVTVWGLVADQQNAKVQGQIQSTAAQASAALTKQAQAINVINPTVPTAEVIAAALPPVQIKPVPPTEKPK